MRSDDLEFRKNKNGSKIASLIRRSEVAFEPASRFARHEGIRPVALLAAKRVWPLAAGS
jgi:hypothetical protein